MGLQHAHTLDLHPFAWIANRPRARDGIVLHPRVLGLQTRLPPRLAQAAGRCCLRFRGMLTSLQQRSRSSSAPSRRAAVHPHPGAPDEAKNRQANSSADRSATESKTGTRAHPNSPAGARIPVYALRRILKGSVFGQTGSEPVVSRTCAPQKSSASKLAADAKARSPSAQHSATGGGRR